MSFDKQDGRGTREPSQARSIEKKKRIVRAAFDLFDRKSYQEVSIRTIAAEADVSIGTIYSYFGDKKEIFIAVRDHYRDEMYQRFLKLIEEELDGADEVEDGIYAVMVTLREFFSRHAMLHKENLILTLTDEEHRRDHVARERANGRAIVDLFYRKFQDRIGRDKTDLVTFVAHHLIREIVQYLALYREEMDEAIVFREVARVMAGYLK
ncbi:MAG: TetR/AcrR family transcriptional regulator [Pseudomonadota bacterium]